MRRPNSSDACGSAAIILGASALAALALSTPARALSVAPPSVRGPAARRAPGTAVRLAAGDAAADDEVDVAIVGAGIGGLAAGAVLNTLYGKKVGIYEAHYLPGGCAHAFERKARGGGPAFTFDSGPTIVLGCSRRPHNALRQVLDAVGQSVDWIPYDGWGMVERPGDGEVRWKCELGPDAFMEGPLREFGGPDAVREFEALRAKTKDLTVGAGIPAMAMRPGPAALVPLLKYLPTFGKLLAAGPEKLTGTFAPYLDGPEFEVKDPWLRNWLDALAFSLSGLPAARTSAAAMAFVVDDMHRAGAALDYPRGGFGAVIDALRRGVESGDGGSLVHLRTAVDKIDFAPDGSKATGVTLADGQRVVAREGVVCNAPVWSLGSLVRPADAAARDRLAELIGDEGRAAPQTWARDRAAGATDPGTKFSIQTRRATEEAEDAEMTGSFLHLHVAINATGLDLGAMEAHYTVMDRGLAGDMGEVVNGVPDGPCGELNMIAVSNPCVIDPTLAPEGHMVLHAYGAGNEPYDVWAKYRKDRSDPEYLKLKEERTQVLWRALESVVPDVRDRVVLDLAGSPLTHERFLRRPRGTNGVATEDYLKDGSTPVPNMVLAGDSIFPGIGIPAVAISGASAAHGLVDPLRQWATLGALEGKGAIERPVGSPGVPRALRRGLATFVPSFLA